ncbi:centrosomal protein of 55 kDa [Lampris incognitus]|uniref:centrosomal protein of 55 kDa n=1 Tax=Lampris incognitus TaxID=2546036 RepID=UPI0024B4AD76|nr:centrosomal protein of 55 kDa [Lampris incognitus]
MNPKGAKETFVAKLGFKSRSSPSGVEMELERVRHENAQLRKKMDELAKRQIKAPSSDKGKLLERILSLETMRERNNQQLLVKEQELEALRRQLAAKGGEVVASLQAQLEQRKQEVEQKDRLFQTLSEETGNLKDKLAAVSARCKALEAQHTQNGQVPQGDLASVQDQLRDALEKNQQWLVYDQQREAYVQSVLARTLELEQQLAQASPGLQQQQPPREPREDEKSDAKLRGNYEQLLKGIQKDLENQRDQAVRAQQELQMQIEQTSRAQSELQHQREQVSKLQDELSAVQRRNDDRSSELESLQRRYHDTSRELEEAKKELKAEQRNNRHAVSEERKASSERADRMRVELDSVDTRLEEERKRSAELLLQVNLLQKSLLSQNDEQRRIAALEQQIQLSIKDFENEKLDRQSMQHQLKKVLKELRKAHDQIARLESTELSEPGAYNKLEFARLTIGDSPGPPSSSRNTSLVDESFLECPKCQAAYPTSLHRELLAHMDYCLA